jgi:hypothetical protein
MIFLRHDLVAATKAWFRRSPEPSSPETVRRSARKNRRYRRISQRSSVHHRSRSVPRGGIDLTRSPPAARWTYSASRRGSQEGNSQPSVLRASQAGSPEAFDETPTWLQPSRLASGCERSRMGGRLGTAGRPFGRRRLQLHSHSALLKCGAANRREVLRWQCKFAWERQ